MAAGRRGLKIQGGNFLHPSVTQFCEQTDQPGCDRVEHNNEWIMAANQAPGDTMEPDNERKLQLFLERAAPIVLESRVLDTENWQRLVALAKDLEMSDGQLRATIEDLRQRGVIERIELQPAKPSAPASENPAEARRQPLKKSQSEPVRNEAAGRQQAKPIVKKVRSLPKPPPLPPRSDARPDTAAVPNVAKPPERESASGPPGREKTFALNSPQPPPPPAPPRPVATPEPVTAAPPADSGSNSTALEKLTARAAAIIAEQRGFTPKTHSLIASAAADLGLSDRHISSVIRSLHQGDSTAKPSEPANDDANQRQRWKEEGKPEPPPHEAPKKPHEIFSAFVEKSLEKLAVGHVSRDLEEGLVAHGTKVLKLSQIYATQLVRDVAHQKSLLLESDTRSPAQEEKAEEQVDPRLQTFLDRAAPILAQNRGLNARSRVLLGAMAEEVGLAHDEVDAAVAMLERKPAETDGLDDLQRERLEPFRRYANELLGQLPQKILTARVHTMMLDRADERFGIDSERARNVLRELAGKMQIQVISEEEALRHIEDLVDEQVGDAIRMESAVKVRVLKEGGQWGLSAEQIEEIIKNRTRKNYRKRRSERNLTNLALVAALIAVLLVFGFLGWAMLGGKMGPDEPTVEAPSVPVIPDQPADNDDSWWSVELVLAVHNATTEFPLLRVKLKSIGSRNPEYRAIAYEEITSHALNRTDDAVQRNLLFSVVAQAHAVEPDEEAANRIRQALVGPIPGPEDRLSERAEDYPRIFGAMRGAVSTLYAAADEPRRGDAMADAIRDVVGSTIDRNQQILQLERQCLGALAERLFRLTISAATSRRADIVRLHQVISEEAGTHLDRGRLASLNAEFLRAYLSANQDSWNAFTSLIDETINNRDPLIVSNLIEVFESTPNAELQTYLETRLLRRAKHEPMADTQRGIASEIRQALGITEVVTAAGRTLDFMQLAKRELARTSTATDERVKAAETATRLSHVATLGCAIAQGEPGMGLFDELIKNEPPTLSAGPPDDEDLFPSLIGTDWDALERIDSAVARLDREGQSNRVERIATIAGVAGRVRDLQPSQAGRLASYLLFKKSEVEQEKVLEHLPKFRHWSQLHLAVADGIYRTNMARDQLQALISGLLDEEITLGDGAAGREAVRGSLLRRAVSKLTVEGSVAADPQLIDQARRLLSAQYVRQATLLGVPPGSYADATGPASVLKAIIQHAAARLAAASPAKAVAEELAEIPHHLEAIEYIAANRLQQTVLLERVWLQLISTELQSKVPEAAEDVARIRRQLEDADRDAGHSMAQLQASQTAQVQLWMLWSRPR